MKSVYELFARLFEVIWTRPLRVIPNFVKSLLSFKAASFDVKGVIALVGAMSNTIKCKLSIS